MREIKVRQWCSLEDDVNYGMHYDMPYRIIRDGGWTNMLFVGRKDKRGKEIYDGDIVKHRFVYPKPFVIVEYFSPGFTLCDINGGSYCDFDWAEWDKFEIIGNKFENPELLK